MSSLTRKHRLVYPAYLSLTEFKLTAISFDYRINNSSALLTHNIPPETIYFGCAMFLARQKTSLSLVCVCLADHSF